MRLLTWLMVILTLPTAFPEAVLAQSFPSKPITAIWPFPPGNTAENKLRAMFGEAAKSLGQPIVIEYRPGAGGRQGVVAVQKSPPDGHVIAFATDTVLTVLAQASASFAPRVDRDYVAVHQVYGVPLVLTAHASLPFKDVKGWIAYAKANPGKLTYGTPGTGTTSHLAMVRLTDTLGVSMLHIPYAGSPYQADLINGTFNMMAFTTTVLTPHIKAGKLNALAQVGSRRATQLSDVPTFREAGFDFEMDTWNTFVAPPGTPAETVAKINAAFNAAQKVPEVAKIFASDESNVYFLTPQQASENIRAEIRRVLPVIKKMNLTFD